MIKVNLKELLPIQREVNEVVETRLGREVRTEEFVLAYNVELFEYFNAVGTWKWWKQNHKVDRERILDELADCFAFFLSIVQISEELNLIELQISPDTVTAFERDVQTTFENLHQFLEGQTKEKVVIDMITVIGTENEVDQRSTSSARFAIALFIATLLFDGITWDELTDAYRKKSLVNIQRQVENY